MIRLSTKETAYSAPPWTPADDTLLQLSCLSSAVSVEVQARVHVDADWATIDTLHIDIRPIVRVAKMPMLRLVSAGNASGMQVIVRDNS